MRQAEWAEEIARKLLEVPLPRRWAHTQAVAAKARTLAPILGDDADRLEAAAWLHDIGYSPVVVVTGFHPLDGARHLRDHEHADELMCQLVAHHSFAAIEAEERGLADQLTDEFAPSSKHLADALTYCDMTTGPDGQPLPANVRLAEIQDRYGPEHVVSRAIHRAAPRIAATVRTIGAEMACLASADRTRQGAVHL